MKRRLIADTDPRYVTMVGILKQQDASEYKHALAAARATHSSEYESIRLRMHERQAHSTATTATATTTPHLSTAHHPSAQYASTPHSNAQPSGSATHISTTNGVQLHSTANTSSTATASQSSQNGTSTASTSSTAATSKHSSALAKAIKNGVLSSQTLSAWSHCNPLPPLTPSVTLNGEQLTPAQAQQLDAQMAAFRCLSRNLPIPGHLLSASAGRSDQYKVGKRDRKARGPPWFVLVLVLALLLPRRSALSSACRCVMCAHHSVLLSLPLGLRCFVGGTSAAASAAGEHAHRLRADHGHSRETHGESDGSTSQRTARYLVSTCVFEDLFVSCPSGLCLLLLCQFVSLFACLVHTQTQTYTCTRTHARTRTHKQIPPPHTHAHAHENIVFPCACRTHLDPFPRSCVALQRCHLLPPLRSWWPLIMN
jgi:QLQ